MKGSIFLVQKTLPRRSMRKGLAFQCAVSIHIHGNLITRKSLVGKVHNQLGWLQPWENVRKSQFENLKGASQGVDWGWSASRATMHRCVQEVEPLFSGPSLEEEWQVHCEVFTATDALGCHIICWCWSTVLYQADSQHSHLSDLRAHHAFICWQALTRCWFPYPVNLCIDQNNL